jgi:fructose-1,6-bisphosphatase/inositol monophosphatase family enzyme
MDHTKELEFAKRIAGEAGLIMQKYYRADQHEETKADHTPVTIADKEVNQLVVDRVQAEYPNYGVLGEELSWQSDREKLWVCDPIDGTPAYIYHIPTSMFSLALVVDGEPQVAVTFSAFTGDLYWAIKTKGAFRNDQPIHVSSRSWGEGTRIAGSSDGAVDGISDRTSLTQQGIKVINAFGSVFKGSLVAEGSLDGRVFTHKGAHDMAAIKLIITEAGGKLTDLDGNEQRYDQAINGAVMSNGLIHDELLKLVRASR